MFRVSLPFALNTRQSAQKAACILLTLSLLLIGTAPACAWGRHAHQMVNAAAIKTLPYPLRSYFLPHQFYLVDHASDPDLQAKHDPKERPRHFVEVEAYDHYPFRKFRKEFVLERMGPSRAQARHGTAMWQIVRFTLYLEQDFRRADWREANHDAVYLAHYAADLTQPLHTVTNYDGQQTGQRGIHARFEVDLVDLMGNRWVLRRQPASEIPNLRAKNFDEFLSSYRQSQAIFAADRKVRTFLPYTSPKFLPAFARAASPIAEKQLDDAANFVGSLWYTAWIRAGKPDLSGWSRSRRGCRAGIAARYGK